MVDSLGSRGSRRWNILGAVTDGRLSLAEVWDAYSRNELDGLADRLSDVDLSALVEEFATSHATRVSPAHAKLAKAYIREAIPQGRRFARTQFTPSFLARFLDGLAVAAKDRRALASGTRLKYHAALSLFARWLAQHGHVAENPMRRVERPRAASPRNRGAVTLRRESLSHTPAHTRGR